MKMEHKKCVVPVVLSVLSDSDEDCQELLQVKHSTDLLNHQLITGLTPQDKHPRLILYYRRKLEPPEEPQHVRQPLCQYAACPVVLNCPLFKTSLTASIHIQTSYHHAKRGCLLVHQATNNQSNKR